jgi:hypothetical protein
MTEYQSQAPANKKEGFLKGIQRNQNLKPFSKQLMQKRSQSVNTINIIKNQNMSQISSKKGANTSNQNISSRDLDPIIESMEKRKKLKEAKKPEDLGGLQRIEYIRMMKGFKYEIKRIKNMSKKGRNDYLQTAIGKLIKTGNKKRISETMNPFIHHQRNFTSVELTNQIKKSHRENGLDLNWESKKRSGILKTPFALNISNVSNVSNGSKASGASAGGLTKHKHSALDKNKIDSQSQYDLYQKLNHLKQEGSINSNLFQNNITNNQSNINKNHSGCCDIRQQDLNLDISDHLFFSNKGLSPSPTPDCAQLIVSSKSNKSISNKLHSPRNKTTGKHTKSNAI